MTQTVGGGPPLEPRPQWIMNKVVNETMERGKKRTGKSRKRILFFFFLQELNRNYLLSLFYFFLMPKFHDLSCETLFIFT